MTFQMMACVITREGEHQMLDPKSYGVNVSPIPRSFTSTPRAPAFRQNVQFFCISACIQASQASLPHCRGIHSISTTSTSHKSSITFPPERLYFKAYHYIQNLSITHYPHSACIQASQASLPHCRGIHSISTTSTSHKSSITIPQSACISRHIRAIKISTLFQGEYQQGHTRKRDWTILASRTLPKPPETKNIQNLCITIPHSACISRHIKTLQISASLTTPTAPAFRQVKRPYPIAEVHQHMSQVKHLNHKHKSQVKHHYPPERLYFKAYQNIQNLSLSPRAPAFRQHSKSMRHDPQSACI